jgi:cytochrome c553
MFEAIDGLSESDINDLATFYAKQEPVRREVRTPFTTAEWIDRCERCHGINGNSTDPRFPMLAGQNEDYLKKVMQAYSSGARPMSVMHAMSEPLTETDIQLIAAHYAAQEPKSVIYMQLPCEDQTEN